MFGHDAPHKSIDLTIVVSSQGKDIDPEVSALRGRVVMMRRIVVKRPKVLDTIRSILVEYKECAYNGTNAKGAKAGIILTTHQAMKEGKHGQKEGREACTEGREGGMDGREEGRHGRTEGRKEGKHGRKEGRKA